MRFFGMLCRKQPHSFIALFAALSFMSACKLVPLEAPGGPGLPIGSSPTDPNLAQPAPTQNQSCSPLSSQNPLLAISIEIKNSTHDVVVGLEQDSLDQMLTAKSGCSVPKVQLALVDGSHNLVSTSDSKPTLIVPWKDYQGPSLDVQFLANDLSKSSFVSVCLKSVVSIADESSWYCLAKAVPAPSTVVPKVVSGLNGTFDSNCISNNAFDACVVHKNPVAQNKAALSPSLRPTSDLRSLQTYGVKIAGLDNSGFLQNSSFRIIPTAGARIQKTAAGNWKHSFSNCSTTPCTSDPNRSLGQLMAFYYLNEQSRIFTERAGVFYAANRNIIVDSYDSTVVNNAYWDRASIVMGVSNISGSSGELALSAEIYLHELGHANAQYASNNAIYGTDPNSTSGGTYCRTQAGCIGAINEGLADYHAAMVFSDNTKSGETFFNTPSGLTLGSGIPRDVNANPSLSAAAIFNLLSNGNRGEIHNLGVLYGAIWWEVRKAAANPLEVDKLFSNHLMSLTSSDTFLTVLTKIKAEDAANFGGKYSAAFETQYVNRGLK